ncbi:Uncharacterised protein [Vibrio cholerae]|nr:Uncharacterised protein [Vibrio cholerae]CSI94664.1 Uncharacterised protein [Vibrio cholerae]
MISEVSSSSVITVTEPSTNSRTLLRFSFISSATLLCWPAAAAIWKFMSLSN